VEGCEALLPGLQALVARCAGHGVERLEVGMAHRGRLSVIHGLLGAPPGSLFAQVPPRARAPLSDDFGGPPTALAPESAACAAPPNADSGWGSGRGHPEQPGAPAQMDNSQNEHHVGDVKYHLGRSATLEYPQARRRIWLAHPVPTPCPGRPSRTAGAACAGCWEISAAARSAEPDPGASPCRCVLLSSEQAPAR